MTVLPYSIGYGFAAFAFVVMSTSKGVIGFMALLAPIILLHAYLLRYTQGLRKFEAKRAEDEAVKLRLHQDKERLQLQALEASERERTKIAGDLHDGVVQNLAGIAFALSAEASQLKSDPEATNGRADLALLLDRSATETRGAMKDLRTLIIDLAPPTLRREGLHAALLEVLRDIKTQGHQHAARSAAESPAPQGPRRAHLPGRPGDAPQRRGACARRRTSSSS